MIVIENDQRGKKKRRETHKKHSRIILWNGKSQKLKKMIHLDCYWNRTTFFRNLIFCIVPRGIEPNLKDTTVAVHGSKVNGQKWNGMLNGFPQPRNHKVPPPELLLCGCMGWWGELDHNIFAFCVYMSASEQRRPVGEERPSFGRLHGIGPTSARCVCVVCLCVQLYSCVCSLVIWAHHAHRIVCGRSIQQQPNILPKYYIPNQRTWTRSNRYFFPLFACSLLTYTHFRKSYFLRMNSVRNWMGWGNAQRELSQKIDDIIFILHFFFNFNWLPEIAGEKKVCDCILFLFGQSFSWARVSITGQSVFVHVNCFSWWFFHSPMKKYRMFTMFISSELLE